MRHPYTQLTLKWLRAEGYEAQVVERWNQFAMRRIDLYGIIDIVAIKPGQILGVQSTSMAAKGKHLEKLYASRLSPLWLQAGGKLLLVCWRLLLEKRGGKRKSYQPAFYFITEETLHESRSRTEIEKTAS
jgi:hypothetical protein